MEGRHSDDVPLLYGRIELQLSNQQHLVNVKEHSPFLWIAPGYSSCDVEVMEGAVQPQIRKSVIRS